MIWGGNFCYWRKKWLTALLSFFARMLIQDGKALTSTRCKAAGVTRFPCDYPFLNRLYSHLFHSSTRHCHSQMGSTILQELWLPTTPYHSPHQTNLDENKHESKDFSEVYSMTRLSRAFGLFAHFTFLKVPLSYIYFISITTKMVSKKISSVLNIVPRMY